MSNSSTKKPKLTIDIFISRAKEKHGDKYDYTDTIYKNIKSKLKIRCKKHGVFEQIAAVHLAGANCPHCRGNSKINTDVFKIKAIDKHGDTYIYDKSICNHPDDLVIVTCRKHGDFKVVAKSHLNGTNCPRCRKHVVDNETFIAKSKSIHGDKYEYLDDSFVFEDQNVKVVCKLHGVFHQKMDNHFRFDGCKKCKTERKMISAALAYRNDKSNYTRSGYIKICESSNGMSNLYIVEMSNDSELFYKVGITKRSLESRFSSNPYKVNKIRFISGEAGFIFDLEKQIHRMLSNSHYRPLIKFEGSTLECFSAIPKSIIKLVDSIGKSNQLQLIA